MPTQSIPIDISQGIGNPPQVNVTSGNAGIISLRPTEKQYINQQVNSGKMSFAQNINVQNDKYGREIVLPGPYINNFTTTTAGIYLEAKGDLISGNLWFVNGTGNTLDRIKTIATGQTPIYDFANTITLSTTSNPGIVDLVFAGTSNSDGIFASLTHLSTGYIGFFVDGNAGSTLTNNIVQLQNSLISTGQPIPMIRTEYEGNIYFGNYHHLGKISNTTINGLTVANVQAAITEDVIAAGIPIPWVITAFGEWNSKLVWAANNEGIGDFSKRNGAGKSKVFFWDYISTTYIGEGLTSPSHYISVLLTDLTGNLLAFGGVDEGRTTIYQFNGYGFSAIFSYIGDMPRNRHSVCFDSIGRLVWITADGKLCRWDRDNDIFDILGFIGSNAVNGGICVNLQSTGYDFLVSSDTYLSVVDLANFIAGGSSSNDSTNRPLAISGLKSIPQQSVIRNVTPTLHKALQSGEKIEVRLYPSNYNQTGTYTVLGSLDFSQDGAITSKNVRTLQTNQTEFAIGYAWQTTVTNTAPGIVSTNVEYNQITTL